MPGFVITKHDEPIDDTVYRTEAEAAKDFPPGNGYGVQPFMVCLTVGFTPESGRWGFQTGDNSFTGGAYGHPFWGVAWISSESHPAWVAREILGEIASQID